MAKENQKIKDIKKIDKVIEAYDSSKINQATSFDLFKKLYQLWRFYKSASSNVKIVNPIGFAITAGLLSKMFLKTPSVMVNAKISLPEDDPNNPMLQQQTRILKKEAEKAQKKVEALLEYQFDNPQAEEPTEEEYISFITEMFVLGTAFAKVEWSRETRKIDGEVETTFDDPVFIHIPTQNIFFQPGAKNIHDSEYIIYKKNVTKAHLRKMAEDGIYENVEECIASNQAKDQTGIEQARGVGGKGNTSEADKNKIEILEYWENDELIVVGNRKHLLRSTSNPNNHGRKPFVAMSYTNVPHEFYGIGVLEPISDMQKITNVTLTQRVEYVSNILNQQYAVVNNGGADEDAIIEGYPIVHVTSVQDVAPLNKGMVQSAAFVQADELIREIERVTGFSGYSSGTPQSSQDKTRGTKGGIEAIIQEAQSRFNLTLKRFEKGVLKKTAQMFIDLNKQHMSETEDKLVMVDSGSGVQGVEIAKAVLTDADWHITIVPGSTGRQEQLEKFQHFLTWVEFASTKLPLSPESTVFEAAKYLDIESPGRFIESQDNMLEKVLKERTFLNNMGGNNAEVGQGPPQGSPAGATGSPVG